MGSGEWRTDDGRKHTGRSVALVFVRKHPALALVLTYLAGTVVGRLDDLWFFQFFKINIFYYSSPEDFFLAPMRNPIVVLFFLIPALIILAVAWMGDKRVKAEEPQIHPPRESHFLDGLWGNPVTRLALGALVVVAIAAALTQNHATRRSSEAKAGVGRRVTFERTDGLTFPEEPLLLGSTGKFFFLYYPQRRVTEIVPVENAAMMTVDSHNRPDSFEDTGKETSSLIR